eukprot:TRINITY_DN7788_c1_g1_i2.p1 TRINITY_DN7788_c1_g1~~TRINITY_DN7788_c1_g1_i2.p1  ORF type:complete len:696 (+),score=117.27 TRINITY_DN7788_c1_g1_i2:116-2203(+)
MLEEPLLDRLRDVVRDLFAASVATSASGAATVRGCGRGVPYRALRPLMRPGAHIDGTLEQDAADIASQYRDRAPHVRSSELDRVGDRLVEGVFKALRDGCRETMSVWDWVQGIDEAAGGAAACSWAPRQLRVVRVVCTAAGIRSEPERVRCWIRLCLCEGTLTAALALLLEHPKKLIECYLSRSLLRSAELSSSLLNVLLPVGGEDLDSRRAKSMRAGVQPFYSPINFDFDVVATQQPAPAASSSSVGSLTPPPEAAEGCSASPLTEEEELCRVQQELDSWRQQRASSACSRSAPVAAAPTSAEVSPVPERPQRTVGRLDVDPALRSSLTDTLLTHHLPFVGGGDQKGLLAHVVSMSTLVERQALARGVPVSAALAANQSVADATDTASNAEPTVIDGQRRRSRCVLRHRMSGARVCVLGGELRMSSVHPPAAFRFEDRRLLHDATGSAVTQQALDEEGVQDGVLRLSPANVATSEQWLYSPNQGYFWEITSASALCPTAPSRDGLPGLTLTSVLTDTRSCTWDMELIGDRAEACGAEEGAGADLTYLLSGTHGEAVRKDESEWTQRAVSPARGPPQRVDPSILLSTLPAHAFGPITAEVGGGRDGSATPSVVIDDRWFGAPGSGAVGDGGWVSVKSDIGRTDREGPPAGSIAALSLELVTDVYEKHGSYRREGGRERERERGRKPAKKKKRKRK